jgi:methionyl-tRNA formyltransferase
MRYAFFGTPEFAAIVLKKLIDAQLPPAVVITNPDRPAGRKKILTSPPAKIVAEDAKISVWQPEQLDEDFKTKLRDLDCDFGIIAAYAKIIRKDVLGIPKLGVLGVHPSLLPKYRGASPIQSAILGGEKETGVTIFLVDEKVDNGPILDDVHVAIDGSDTYQTLSKKLAETGGKLAANVIPRYISREITSLPQKESEATFTKKFTTEDGFVSPTDLETALSGGSSDIAARIFNKIHALNPEPGVWTEKSSMASGKRVKLLDGELQEGALVLKKIQIEGKLPMDLG